MSKYLLLSLANIDCDYSIPWGNVTRKYDSLDGPNGLICGICKDPGVDLKKSGFLKGWEGLDTALGRLRPTDRLVIQPPGDTSLLNLKPAGRNCINNHHECIDWVANMSLAEYSKNYNENHWLQTWQPVVPDFSKLKYVKNCIENTERQNILKDCGVLNKMKESSKLYTLMDGIYSGLAADYQQVIQQIISNSSPERRQLPDGLDKLKLINWGESDDSLQPFSYLFLTYVYYYQSGCGWWRKARCGVITPIQTNTCKTIRHLYNSINRNRLKLMMIVLLILGIALAGKVLVEVVRWPVTADYPGVAWKSKLLVSSALIVLSAIMLWKPRPINGLKNLTSQVVVIAINILVVLLFFSSLPVISVLITSVVIGCLLGMLLILGPQ